MSTPFPGLHFFLSLLSYHVCGLPTYPAACLPLFLAYTSSYVLSTTTSCIPKSTVNPCLLLAIIIWLLSTPVCCLPLSPVYPAYFLQLSAVYQRLLSTPCLLTTTVCCIPLSAVYPCLLPTTDCCLPLSAVYHCLLSILPAFCNCTLYTTVCCLHIACVLQLSTVYPCLLSTTVCCLSCLLSTTVCCLPLSTVFLFLLLKQFFNIRIIGRGFHPQGKKKVNPSGSKNYSFYRTLAF
jgi:hypothetical protein